MSTALTAPTKIEADPIGTALKAAGVTSAAIEALAKDFGELAARTQPLETPEEYEVVKRAQLSCRDVRTAVTSALKIERDEAVKYQKFVIQEEKRILAQIATTEEPLKKLREDYDNRILLAQQEEARQWMEKMNLRKQAAFDIGYYFNGQAYLLDRENGEAPWVLREDQVAGMAMSDEALYALLEAQAAELKMTREIKAEAEAKAKEEQKAQAAAIQAEADRIAAAQAELARKQNEMDAREAQMNARVNEARKNELIAVGCGTYSDRGEEIVGVPTGIGGWGHVYGVADLASIPEENWAAIVQMCKEEKEAYEEGARQREIVARHLREQQEQERIAREEALKAEAAQKAVEAERSRLAAEAEAKKKQEELAAQQAAEKALQASDREKVESLAHRLCCEFIVAPLPEMKSATGKAAMKVYARQLTEIHASMIVLSKEL